MTIRQHPPTEIALDPEVPAVRITREFDYIVQGIGRKASS